MEIGVVKNKQRNALETVARPMVTYRFIQLLQYFSSLHTN